MKTLFYIFLISFIWSTDGCTDPMAFNCTDDQDYHSYIIDVQGIVYDNSCNWSYNYSDSSYVDEGNCDFLNIPNDNDFACTGYYNPQATIDDGSCRYPQAPSDENVFFTILSDNEIYVDWSDFSPPDNAEFQSIHIQRCTEESCSWVEGAGNFDTYTETNIIDEHEWELDSPIKYLFAVKYASNTYWGQAIDYTYLTPTEGCTDPDASNYNLDANIDDGSCILLDIDLNEVSSFILNRVYPNPFNPNVTIDFSIDEFDYVLIDIIDLNGKMIDRLIENNFSSGNHIVKWDASKFSTGIYFVRISSKKRTSSILKKIIYLK